MRFWILSTSFVSLAAMGCIITPPDWSDGNNPPSGDTGWDAGSGVVDFAWQVGASGCQAAGIETVQVTIGSETERFDCRTGEGTMQVGVGNYTRAEAIGLDATNSPRYAGAIEQSFSVGRDERTSIGTFRLQANTGRVEVSWSFDNGQLCARNGIVELDIALLERNRIQKQVFTPCDAAVAVIPEVVAGEYEISVLANDADGLPEFTASGDLIVLEGEDTVIDLVLSQTN